MAETALRLTGVSLLDADLTATVALRAVAGLADEASVVVLDRTCQPVRYTLLSAGKVARAARRCEPRSALRDALRLEQLTPATLVDLATAAGVGPESLLSIGTLVVRGPEVIGLVTTEGSEGSAGTRPRAPADAAPQPAVFQPSPPIPAGRPDQQLYDKAIGGGGGYQHGVGHRGGGGGYDGGRLGRFHAFPHINAPAIVAGRMPFTLEVGFTSQRPAQPEGAIPVVLGDVTATVGFEVQIAGLGFDFPQGVKFRLLVDRDALTGTVLVPVQPQPVPTRTTRSIRVSYAHEGAVVADAWCELDVIPEGTRPPDHPEPPEAAALCGGSGVQVGVAASSPDLTVTVRTTPGRPEVEWLFTTPHNVIQPSERVTTEFRDGTPEAFANALMAQLPAAKDKPLLLADVTGLGLQVAAAYPPQFWRMLAAIWDAVPHGTVPTLLLMTNEPFVPWELAYLEPNRFITDQRASRLSGPLLLGAQWSIGRWLSPVPQAFGPDRPSAPPQEVVEAPTMAVVKGEYTKAGVKALPGAVREAEELASAYDAVLVPIDETSVAQLLDDKVERDGQPYRPFVLHFACHGQADTTNLQHTGILLDDRRLLGPLAIEASVLGRSAKPFVFLNACQVGAAAYTLNGYGGLAGAFIQSGARGFVAPLWNVDDDLALTLSSGFYKRVLDHGESVGEALRLMRQTFTEGGVRTATPLAYVFYGHPRLRLTRAE